MILQFVTIFKLNLNDAFQLNIQAYFTVHKRNYYNNKFTKLS